MQIESYTLKFQHGDEIDTSEFADFLFLFRGVYAAGLQVILSRPYTESLSEPVKFANLVVGQLNKLNVSEIDSLFRQDLGHHRLVTKSMSHESPIELVVTGVVVAIVSAVILSGGKLKVLGLLEADLPPVGKGIEKLRGALARSTRAPVGYGIKSRKITLTKAELTELMRQDASKRNRGGFQRFLTGLQFRVNKKDRTLELSEDDMEKIIRYGRDPKKGGWQAMIRRIFGSHFDFGGNE